MNEKIEHALYLEAMVREGQGLVREIWQQLHDYLKTLSRNTAKILRTSNKARMELLKIFI